MRPLLRWHRGRVVILGDAAHGMLPHHGQGANTSIEDAFALAALLADARPTTWRPPSPGSRPCAAPAPARSSAARWVTSSLLHLPDGPMAEARNRKVARVPEDFGWIHEYDVQQELQNIGVHSRDVPGRHQVDTRRSRHGAGRDTRRHRDHVLSSVAGVDPAEVTPEKSFTGDLGIDSMTMLEAVVALEDRFGLLIADDDWSQFSTVGDLVSTWSAPESAHPLDPVVR